MTSSVMCNLCWPNAVEIGRIGPSIAVMLNEGEYSLIGFNGHKDDKIYTFKEKPSPDPDPECEQDSEEVRTWDNQVLFFDKDFRLEPSISFELLGNCKEHCGWKREWFASWFYDFVGNLIAKYEGKVVHTKKSDKDGLGWNYRVMVHEDENPRGSTCKSARHFAIHEVYYSPDGKIGYSTDPLVMDFESVESLEWTAERILEAIQKEVLVYVRDTPDTN